ncbi:MAG: hypothetical protein KDD53_00575 [Bdellovibrionales bacterium]|nr:hypothetical protein [Bdellovibrionales bacterium]
MADKKKQNRTDNLLTELSEHPDPTANSAADLVVEPESDALKDDFARELERTLKETEQEVLGIVAIDEGPDAVATWQSARLVIEKFQPIPWFIWRLSNFVLGKPGKIAPVTEGLVFGLRRLLFATASDKTLGSGEKITSVRKALNTVEPDVIAAVSVVYAVCKKMLRSPFERIWRPILDDALLRTQIGYYVGRKDPSFGAGRGMLAGFANRIGLAVLIATGDLTRAQKALEQLATGAPIKDIGLLLYQCEPLQVSAMLLSAAGCGRDAAFGIVRYASGQAPNTIENEEQYQWLAAFTLIEKLRTNQIDDSDQQFWSSLSLDSQEDKTKLLEHAKLIVRRGHGWSWLTS